MANKPVTAFVLMTIAPGEAQNVVVNLYNSNWAKRDTNPRAGAYIRGAWVLTGSYDAIAMLEADTTKQLTDLVTAMVTMQQHSPGPISSTQTFVATDGLWG